MADTTSPIVGIDLGTTNSVVAAWDDNGDARVLADKNGYKIQPSVVSFHPNGSVVVGAEAKQRRIIDPRNTVYSVKRLIGRTFRSREVTAGTERMAYVIKEGVNQQPVIVTRAGEFAVPEISAIVLDHMRNIAVANLDTEVSRAVVTVPANFTDAQRSATATAGAIAGLTVVRVLNEPTAAALAYGHNRKLNKTIAVFDFGGGTFDITLLKLEDTVFQVLATAGDSFLGGDDIDERLVDHMVHLFLEKERMDLRHNITAMQRLRAVAEQIKIELSRKRKAVVKVDEIAYGDGGSPLDLTLEITREEFVSRIADVVERAFPVCAEAMKIAGLSNAQIDDVVLVGGTTKMPLVRERVAQVFDRQPRTDVNPDEAVAVGAALQGVSLQRILDRAQSGAPTLHETRPPPQRRTSPGPVPAPIGDEEEPTAVQRTSAPAGPPPIPPRRSTQPGMPVTRPPSTERPARPGSHSDDISLPDPAAATPFARITRPPSEPGAAARKTLMGAPAPATAARPIDMATLIPTSFDDMQTDVARGAGEPDSFFDDDAPTIPPAAPPTAPTMIGAASAAGPGEPTSLDLEAPTQVEPQIAAPIPTVLDITPHTLGIGTIAGYCEELITRNAQVPIETKKTFSTSRDLQDMVRIRVCQGESRRIDDNLVLGDVVLDGLEPRPRGQTKIEVTFHIDASGILHVRARDEATGKEQRANLDIEGAQSAEQVDAARERLREIRQ